MSHRCGANIASEIINTYANCNNGIAAFCDLIIKYGGSPEVHQLIYSKLINQPFTFKYKGGLGGYIKDFEQAYVKHDENEAKLAQLENRYPNITHDNVKLKNFYNNLRHEGSLRGTIRTSIGLNHTYREALQYFASEALLSAHADNELAGTRATRKVNIADLNMQQLQEYMMQKLSRDLVLTSDLYHCIPEEARETFRKNREALQAKLDAQQGDKDKKEPYKPYKKDSSKAPLPRQYTSRANATVAEVLEQQADVADESSDTDDSMAAPSMFYHHLQQYHEAMEDHVTESSYFNHNISYEPSTEVRTTEIRSNISLSMQQKNQFLLLSDNGANASLISTHAFHIDTVVPGRQATIKGCKEDYVSKKHQIGTGRSVICFTVDGHDYESGI